MTIPFAEEKLKVLIKARELLAKGWGQGAYAVDLVTGENIDVYSELVLQRSCKFCLVGAVRAAMQQDHFGLTSYQVLDHLAFEETGSAINWNDAPGRTQAEVLAKVDSAIASLS